MCSNLDMHLKESVLISITFSSTYKCVSAHIALNSIMSTLICNKGLGSLWKWDVFYKAIVSIKGRREEGIKFQPRLANLILFIKTKAPRKCLDL